MNVTIVPRTGLQLRCPVIAASGTFGYGTEFARHGPKLKRIKRNSNKNLRTGIEPILSAKEKSPLRWFLNEPSSAEENDLEC